MKRALSIGLVALVLIISSFTVSSLLSPQLSSGTTGIGTQLQVKEILWDGGILNGEYIITIDNPTNRIIEASVYVYAQNMDEKWDFVRCGEGSNQKNIALLTVFYPNSEIEIGTRETNYLFSESLKIIVVSGDEYLMEKTVQVTKFVRFEVISVEWGKLVNRSYEPETARWLNFTLFNHGTAEATPEFRLNGDSRGWNVQEGLTSILMMGDIKVSDYILYYENKLIWEGTVS